MDLIEEKNKKIIVQINGKKREIIEVENNSDLESIKKTLLKNTKISKLIRNSEGGEIVFIKNKLINFITD
jgi:leucyl-tRNA synthetase